MIIFLILMKAHSIIFKRKLDVSRVIFCFLLHEQLIICNTFHLIKTFDIISKTWMIQKVHIHHCQHTYTAPIPIHSLHHSGPSTIRHKKTSQSLKVPNLHMLQFCWCTIYGICYNTY